MNEYIHTERFSLLGGFLSKSLVLWWPLCLPLPYVLLWKPWLASFLVLPFAPMKLFCLEVYESHNKHVVSMCAITKACSNYNCSQPPQWQLIAQWATSHTIAATAIYLYIYMQHVTCWYWLLLYTYNASCVLLSVLVLIATCDLFWFHQRNCDSGFRVLVLVVLAASSYYY